MVTVNWVLSKEKAISYLAKELVDIPMVLSHPFDEVVKLLDEIADLARSQRYQSNANSAAYIVTAEVETSGPRKGQRERLPDRLFSDPSSHEMTNLTHLSNLSRSARTSQTPFMIELRSCSFSACIGTLSSRSMI